MDIKDNEIHTVLFKEGKLFLNNVQIGGEGVEQNKDIVFQFRVPKEKDPSVLEINISDTIVGIERLKK